MNEKDILDQMKNMAVSAGNVLNAATSAQAVLNGLVAHKDDIPEDIFKHLESSQTMIIKGRKDLNAELGKIEKTLKKNGNRTSR